MQKAWRPGIWLTVLILGAWMAAGCASKPKVDWAARVGNYTYDEAIREMGPPDKASELSGGGRVADWYQGRGPSFSFGVGMGSYGRGGGVGVGQGVTTGGEGRYLRLTFGEDGRLSAWQRVGR